MIPQKKSLTGLRATGRHTAKTVIPLAMRLAAELRNDLAKTGRKAGDRFESQNELARRFKTSTVTAREAVALLVQEGLLERRFGSGTFVTGRQPERFVAVVTELDISNPALSPAFLIMLQSVRRHLTAAGLKTRVYIGHQNPFDGPEPARISSWEFWHDLEAGRIIGLVTIGTSPDLGQQAVTGRTIPFIDGVSLEGVHFWDDRELVIKGLKVLADKGCRRVACAAAGEGLHPLLDLFNRSIGRYKMSSRPEWSILAPLPQNGGDGAAVLRSLWLSCPEKPDGLLVLDDMLYREMGPFFMANGIRVPQELVVVSHANAHDPRPLIPEPIRLNVDMEAVGVAMAWNLLNRMKDPASKPEMIPVPVRVSDEGKSKHVEWDFTRELVT